MNHRSWIFVNTNGSRMDLGVYHGADSGNLLIYCNDKVLQLDFHIHDSKQYKFFLEDELCELNISKVGRKKFDYTFKVDEKSLTPKNIERNKKRKIWNYQGVGFILGFMLLTVICGAIFWSLRGVYLERQLAKYGVEAMVSVQVTQRGSTGKKFEMHYRYKYKDEAFYNTTGIIFKPPTTPYGFPIRNNDEFVIRYASVWPRNHEIDYSRPADFVLERYFMMTIRKHWELNPEISLDELECQVEAAYEAGGVYGLADLYFQDIAPSDQALHDANSYSRLIRDSTYQVKIYDCWAEQ